MLKEKLKSKELHLGLVQKKTSDLEEKDKMRSALAIDRDDAILTVQKLQHKVERLQHALGNERVKVTNLKAELAETNELKVFMHLSLRLIPLPKFIRDVYESLCYFVYLRLCLWNRRQK